jgi:TolA-binding protein
MKTTTVLLLFTLTCAVGSGQPNTNHIVQSATHFNGYTNYWHDTYGKVYRYGSVFKLAQLDVEKTIAQSKMNVAEDLHLNGLDMQEGFMDYLLQQDFQFQSHLSVADIQRKSAQTNLQNTTLMIPIGVSNSIATSWAPSISQTSKPSWRKLATETLHLSFHKTQTRQREPFS